MPRPRKSKPEHWLAGSVPQYSDVPEQGPGFRAGRPKMPKDLVPVAQAEWKRMVKQLLQRGTLTRVDESALEIYCCTFARWKKVAALAEANPLTETTWVDSSGVERTKVVENPASKIAARLENSLRAYQREFSATPASRDKTKRVAPPAVEKKEPEPGSFEWYEKQSPAPPAETPTALPEQEQVLEV